MRVIGLDYGTKTVGVAVSDELMLTAQPYETIERKSPGKLRQTLAEIERVITEYNCGRIVLGYPKNMNGTVGERAELCQKFGDGLKELTGLPVVMWDERCTTVSAHSYLNATNTRGKKRKAVVDAVAATIILESYMAYRKNQANSQV